MKAAAAMASIVAVALLATVPLAHAQDAAAGKAKAAACAMCHGPAGIAVAPETPNLAGQPASYLEAQLKAYRGGIRKHEIMSLMAAPLTDADIANLAAWFSSVKVKVASPG
jgi:cytochrome c553